jgi:hypothetical protein
MASSADRALQGRGGPPVPAHHPVPIEKCPALANVLNQISAGLFNDGNVYETTLIPVRALAPCIHFFYDADIVWTGYSSARYGRRSVPRPDRVGEEVDTDHHEGMLHLFLRRIVLVLLFLERSAGYTIGCGGHAGC